ncbi:MAG: OB-fold domain-containing protein [Hymenobacter sp.]
MIAYLDGKLAYKDAYAGHYGRWAAWATKSRFRWPPTPSCPAEGEKAKIYTYQHIKEDGQTLYGFLDPNEKALFMLPDIGVGHWAGHGHRDGEQHGRGRNPARPS